MACVGCLQLYFEDVNKMWLYCCVRSACVREGVKFEEEDPLVFADGILIEDFNAWATGQEPEEEKKRVSG